MSLLEQAKAQHDEKAAAELAERRAQARTDGKAEAEKLTDEWGLPVVWKRTGNVTMRGASHGRSYPVTAYGVREFLVADEVRVAHGRHPSSASSSHTQFWLILACECGADAYVGFNPPTIIKVGGTPTKTTDERRALFIEQLGKAQAAEKPLCTTHRLELEDARCSHCGQPYYDREA